MSKVRLCIAGSRDYPLPELVSDYVLRLKPYVSVLVNGMCPRGVDKVALDAAHKHGIDVEEHKPDWDAYGRAAGPRRNTKMVYVSDAVVCFWDGKSKGTKNIIGTARSQGKLKAVYGPNGERMW